MKYFIFFLLIVGMSHAGITEIPGTLEKLKLIEDKTSFAYEELAFQAASDTLNSGKEALASFDSARALRILSVGARILPWRNDIVGLRTIALETYIKITNSYIQTENCEELVPRTKFLSVVAPDGILKLEAIPKKCEAAKQSVVKAASPDRSLDEIFTTPEPPRTEAMEKSHFTDLPSQIEYLVQKNNNFPAAELLLIRFKALYDFWKGARMTCNSFNVDPNVTDITNIRLNGYCHPSNDFVFPTKEAVQARYEKDLVAVREILAVIGYHDSSLYVYSQFLGKTRSEQKIKTTPPLAAKFSRLDFFNTYETFVMDVMIENATGLQLIKKVLGTLDIYSNGAPVNMLKFKFRIHRTAFNVFGKTVPNEREPSTTYEFFLPDFEAQPVQLVFNDIKTVNTLKNVIYNPNFEDTYKLHKQWFNFKLDFGQNKNLNWDNSEIYRQIFRTNDIQAFWALEYKDK